MALDGWGTLHDVVAARVGGADWIFARARAPGVTRHVLVGSDGRALAVGLVGGDARAMLRAALREGEIPSRIAALAARLEGAHLVGVDARALVADAAGQRLVVAVDSSARLVATEASDVVPAPVDEEAARVFGEALARRLAEAALDAARTRVVRQVAAATLRLSRRAAAIRGDLARIDGARADAVRARLFVAAAATAPRGATSLSAVDWSTGETVTLPLDPAKPARAQLDAVFKRAKRLEDGAKVGAARLADTERAAAILRDVAARAPSAPDVLALESLVAEARAAAPRDLRAPASSAPARRKDAAASLPYRTFTSADGGVILVGRGAAKNDELTLHVAKPHDLWLHAKGHAGAHVVVRLPRGASCPAERLVDAAHLAAHFSDARGEPVAEVSYTPKRYVRKPRGSAPGLVTLDREKVLVLRLEDARMARLLASEQGA